jgi:hypothetical protein
MTKSGFKPIDGLSAFTIITYFKPATATGSHSLVSELKVGPDWNSRLELYCEGADLQGRLGSGAAYISVTLTGHITTGHFYLGGIAWDKTVNSGKMDVFLYDFNTTKWYTGTSASGVTGTASADGDFCIGDRFVGGTMKFQGRIYFTAINNAKLNNGSITNRVALFDSIAKDYIGGSSAYYYWTLNEGTGTTANDWATGWWITEEWTLDANTLGPLWYGVENWTLDIVTSLLGWHAVESWTLDIVGRLRAWWSAENWTLDLFTLGPSWHVTELWSMLLVTLEPLWHRAELWVVNLQTHSIFPVLEHDPLFFVFIGGIIGSILCGVITLGKIKAQETEGLYLWIVLLIICLCLTFGVFLT